MKLKKNKSIIFFKIKLNINKCKKIVTFRKDLFTL